MAYFAFLILWYCHTTLPKRPYNIVPFVTREWFSEGAVENLLERCTHIQLLDGSVNWFNKRSTFHGRFDFCFSSSVTISAGDRNIDDIQGRATFLNEVTNKITPEEEQECPEMKFSHFQPPLGVVVSSFDLLNKREECFQIGFSKPQRKPKSHAHARHHIDSDLQSISKNFSQNFNTCVEERYRESNHAIITGYRQNIVVTHLPTLKQIMRPRALEYGMKVFKLKPIIFKSENGRKIQSLSSSISRSFVVIHKHNLWGKA
ncbi:hypothetical protein ACJX0J_009840 [Zea mays]